MLYKVKKCKECSKEIIQRSSLDTFCSWQCKQKYSKKKSKPTKVKPISDKRKKQEQAYLVANRIFLMEERNKFCPVMALLHNRTVKTTEVHHKAGRENEMLLDMEYWLAVSREGHEFIHSNHEISYEQGWIITK